MKKLCIFVAAISSMMAFESCSEGVMNDETMALKPEGMLRVGTRDDDAHSVKDGRIYVMDEAGHCVSVLSVSASQPQVTKGLPKGTYDLYAVGGDDLSGLTLPEVNDATTNSDITLAANQTMGDLQWGHAQVTLVRGDAKDLNISLERKVVCITGISILEVPAEVTAVDVSIRPLYKVLKLDGSYYFDDFFMAISLTKHDATWETNEPVYCFPSAGRAIITISMTTAEGERHYSYVTGEEGLPANTQVQIHATYSEAWATSIKASLTYAAWGEPVTMTFDFNEDNAGNKRENKDKAVPTVGQTYGGYYVVSVDAEHRKAVLLRKKQDNGISNQDLLDTAFAALVNKPTGATGNWRLPTPAECEVFALDATLSFRAFDHGYYCLDGETIKSYDIDIVNGVLKHTGFTEGFNAETWFRPVIEITY